MGKPIIKTEHSPAPQPERAIYGFFLLIFSLSFYAIYLILLLTPDSALDWIGLDYLTEIKYWLLAVPGYLALLPFLIVATSLSINMMRTNDYEDINSIRDDKSKEPMPRRCQHSIDPMYDLPIGEMCQYLYLSGVSGGGKYGKKSQ